MVRIAGIKSALSETIGAAEGSVVVFPTILACGFIVSQPLGHGAVSAGIFAAFSATILISVLRGCLCSAPLHLVSPKTTYAAILAELAIEISHGHGGHGTAPALLLTAIFLCTILAGLFQVAFSALRLGHLIKYVPLPVLAGFINGLVFHIVGATLPVMFGCEGWHDLFALLHPGSAFPFGAVLLGIFAGAVTALTPSLVRMLPGTFFGLLVGTVGYQVLSWVFPDLSLGQTIGHFVTGAAGPLFSLQGAAIADLVRHDTSPELIEPVLATAFTLAVIASIQSLQSISAADAVFETRHDSNRELLYQGLGNALSGLLGGLPAGGSPSVTEVVADRGGRTGWANVGYSFWVLVLALAAIGVLGFIPLSVMAGVVTVSVLFALDDWSIDLVRRLRTEKNASARHSLQLATAVMVIVTLLVVFFGVLVALMAGLMLSFGLFIYSSSLKIVRRDYEGGDIRSRTARQQTDLALLRKQGQQILVVEAQGPIFFGSVAQLVDTIEGKSEGRTVVILDFRRTSGCDTSGARALERLDRFLAKRDCQLFLASIGPSRPLRAFFDSVGYSAPAQEDRYFVDMDSALSRAEDIILERSGHTADYVSEIPLSELELTAGLDGEGIEALSAALQRIEAPTGTKLIAEGDAGDRTYFLVSGRVSIRKRFPGSDRWLTLATFRPGLAFGEMAMLTGQPRTADVDAETPVVCYMLTAERFESLRADHPAIYERLLHNMSCRFIALLGDMSRTVQLLER